MVEIEPVSRTTAAPRSPPFQVVPPVTVNVNAPLSRVPEPLKVTLATERFVSSETSWLMTALSYDCGKLAAPHVAGLFHAPLVTLVYVVGATKVNPLTSDPVPAAVVTST